MNLKTTINKRGSSTVFLLMVLSSMLLVSLTLIQAAIWISGQSVGQSMALLAGRSLLTEYDRNLKQEYGLFGFRGETGRLSGDLAYYMEPYYKQNPYYKLRDVEIDVSKYRLTNPTVLQDAIVEYMMFVTSKGLADLLMETGEKGKPTDVEPPVYPAGRTLRNKKVLDSLPSAALAENPDILSTAIAGLSDWRNVFENTSKRFMVNQYILLEFKNAQKDIPGKDTFFNYEAEYILKGEADDQKNKSLFRRDLLLLRNVVNLGIIYSNQTMRQQVVAAAELLTPGPAALVTQIIIAEGWALAEAENDVRLLEHGKRVPMNKTVETWAIDIQSVIDGQESGYVDTKANTGMNYQGYLQVFLFFQNNNVKLSRVMDLIQINIQGNFDKTFLMSEHQAGLAYEAHINYFTIRGETKY